MRRILFLPLLIVIGVFFTHCSRTDENAKSVIQSQGEIRNCIVDPTFDANFKNCILTAARIYSGDAIPFRDRAKAIKCLEALTGHVSFIEMTGDTPYLYLLNKRAPDPEVNYFLKDLGYWHQWFEENKCSMSYKEANQIIKDFGDSENLDWPDFPPPDAYLD